MMLSCFQRAVRVVGRKHNNFRFCFIRQFSTKNTDISDILKQVGDGKLSPSEAETMLLQHNLNGKLQSSEPSPDEVLKSFANLDHSRSSRTGFPEAVFGAGKTPDQISRIIDDMARNFNEIVESGQSQVTSSQRAILATRYVFLQ
jgi:NCAIR mutase (PurE)-related protein